jgi:hypothetical protein
MPSSAWACEARRTCRRRRRHATQNRADASNNELFRQNNPSILTTSHTSFVFGTPLVSDKLTIEFDSINLGNLSDDIAIDNIAFGQVPEPTTLSLLALGGLALLSRRRKQSTAVC